MKRTKREFYDHRLQERTSKPDCLHHRWPGPPPDCYSNHMHPDRPTSDQITAHPDCPSAHMYQPATCSAISTAMSAMMMSSERSDFLSSRTSSTNLALASSGPSCDWRLLFVFWRCRVLLLLWRCWGWIGKWSAAACGLCGCCSIRCAAAAPVPPPWLQRSNRHRFKHRHSGPHHAITRTSQSTSHHHQPPPATISHHHHHQSPSINQSITLAFSASKRFSMS